MYQQAVMVDADGAVCAALGEGGVRPVGRKDSTPCVGERC